MSDPEEAAQLARALGHRFAEPVLLETALTHPSCAFERDESRGNERLEFLGDAVLDLAVAELLYRRHPDWREGELTRARAALVNTRSLAAKSRALGLDAHVRLGRTEQRTGGAAKDSILANVFEAVIGALYLDAGLPAVVALGQRVFAAELEGGEAVLARDPKTRFQEWAHAAHRVTPRYRLLSDSDVEEAEDRFRVAVELCSEIFGRGAGRTKRAAERAAAVEALERVLVRGEASAVNEDDSRG